LAKVFEPFFSTREGGLGLGLSLCESSGAGHGRAFERCRSASPRRRVHPADAYSQRPPHDRAAFSLIHLIDDDEAVRSSLALLISTVGLRVQPWADPQTFLQTFDRESIGAIVLDVRMPGISGLTVLDTPEGTRGGPARHHAHRARHHRHVPPRLQIRRRRVSGKAGR